MWIPAEILDLLTQSLQIAQAEDHIEQTHAGIDSLSETQLHPLLCQAFTNNSIGVHQEVAYPTSPRKKPHDSQRQRCDLVFTPEKTKRIFDPVHEQRIRDELAQTLFAECTLDDQASQGTCLPEQAYWIEVKSVAQYSYIDGVPIANSAYASELTTGPKADVIKLASDPLIHAGGALVVLFTEYQEAAGRMISAKPSVR